MRKSTLPFRFHLTTLAIPSASTVIMRRSKLSRMQLIYAWDRPGAPSVTLLEGCRFVAAPVANATGRIGSGRVGADGALGFHSWCGDERTRVVLLHSGHGCRAPTQHHAASLRTFRNLSCPLPAACHLLCTCCAPAVHLLCTCCLPPANAPLFRSSPHASSRSDC